MTPEDQLDQVLKFLDNDNDNFEVFKDVKAKIGFEIGNKDLDLLLDKLFLDGYIIKKVSTANNADKLLPPSYYRITFQGRLFLSRGGYLQESISSKRKNYWTIAKTIAATLNAIVILLIALFGVLIAYDDKQKTNQIETLQFKLDSLKTTQVVEDTLIKK